MIPEHLYQPLFNTLLACDPFENDLALRNLFSRPGLRPWRNALQATTNRRQRVESAMAVLAERYNNRGEYALILFLQALRDRLDPADQLYQQLDTLTEQMSQAFTRPISRPIVTMDSPVRRRKGLIVAVSSGPPAIPAEAAIDYHAALENGVTRPDTLSHCWLLVGPGEGPISSPANANRLLALLLARGVIAKRQELPDADEIENVFASMQRIVHEARAHFGLTQDSIIADYTGGTKSMTAGIVLGALAAGIDVQYMKPNAYLPDGRADKAVGSSPRQVDITFAGGREGTKIT